MYRELMSTPESFGDESASFIIDTFDIIISYFEIQAEALSNAGLLMRVRLKLI